MKKIFLFSCTLLVLLMSCKSDFAVERSIVIDAPNDIVWEQVKFFKNWESWSPWYADDSTMKMEYLGEDGNVESSYSWFGEESGSGSISNVGLTEGEELLYHTKFFEPWESESDGYVRLRQTEDGKTEVKWGFTGVNKGIASLFLNMDDLVGPDFEKGLELLKKHTEELAAQAPKIIVEEINFEGQTYVAARALVDIASLQNFYATNFEKIMTSGITMEGGSPSGIYYTWDMENMQSDMAAAVPVAKGTNAPEGTSIIELPKSKALLINHYGSYESIGTAHEFLESYMFENNFEYLGPAIEEYVTDPLVETDPSKQLTRLIYLVK